MTPASDGAAAGPPSGSAGAVGGAIFLLSLAAFASAAALRLCDSMLPALADSFATSVGKAALAITATSVAYGVCQLFFGPLGDRFGKLRVITWACLASTLGALACAASTSLDALIAARALTGATTAALIPLSMAWIGDVVPFNERQPALARFMSGQIIGLVSGQALGGFFADFVGWRWGFVLLAASYLAVGVLLLRSVAPIAARIAASGLSGGTPGSTRQRIRQVFAHRAAWTILAIVFVESMMTFGVLAFIPTFLHRRFGISLFHAGAIVATFGLGGLLYTVFARRWLRSLGAGGLAITGGTVVGAAFLILAVAPHWIWGLIASTAAGLGFYQIHNTLQTQATQLAPEARGTAVSIFAACFFLGQASGVALGSLVIDHASPVWLFLASATVLPLLGWRLRLHLKRSAENDLAADSLQQKSAPTRPAASAGGSPS